MHNKKIQFIILTACVALVLVGCSKQEALTNTNQAITTSTAVMPTNAVKSNNTNSGNMDELDISNWQEYKNEEFKIKFQHPDSWVARVINEPSMDLNLGDITLSHDVCKMHISKPHLNIAEKNKKLIQDALETGVYNNHEIEILKINNLNGFKYHYYVNNEGQKGDIYEFLNDDISITALLKSGYEMKECTDIFEIIISTIRPL